jgi:hypothetical protein
VFYRAKISTHSAIPLSLSSAPKTKIFPIRPNEEMKTVIQLEVKKFSVPTGTKQ